MHMHTHTHTHTHTQLICIEFKRENCMWLESVNKHAEHKQPSILFHTHAYATKKKHTERKWPNIFIVMRTRIRFFSFPFFVHLWFIHSLISLSLPLDMCNVYAYEYEHLDEISTWKFFFSLLSSVCTVFITQAQCVTGVNVHIIVATGG